MIRTIERRGREVAAQAFAGFGPNDARPIGEAFLSASPDEGRMYPTDVERSDEGIAFRVRRCPLKDAWMEAGVDDASLATLCRIAGAFDRGLFEATGVRSRTSPGRPDMVPVAATSGSPTEPDRRLLRVRVAFARRRTSRRPMHSKAGIRARGEAPTHGITVDPYATRASVVAADRIGPAIVWYGRGHGANGDNMTRFAMLILL